MKKFDKNRRMFLQGSGGTLLAIPFLSSLSSKAEAQGQTDLNYVQIMQDFRTVNFFPYAMPRIDAGDGVKHQRLSEFSGDLSQVLKTNFQDLRNKISIVDGLHPLTKNSNHNCTIATCGVGITSDKANVVTKQLISMDRLMEISGKGKAVRISPDGDSDSTHKHHSFSYDRGSDGVGKVIFPIADSRVLFNRFFNGQPSEGNAKLVDMIVEDYRQIKSGTAISKEDKIKLEAYVDLLNDLQQNMIERDAIVRSCQDNPSLRNEVGNINNIYDNFMDICVAALSCGHVKIVGMAIQHALFNNAIIPASTGNIAHSNLGHSNNSGKLNSQIYPNAAWRANIVARFIRKLDQMPLGNGTLLDKTIVYYSGEFSSLRLQGTEFGGQFGAHDASSAYPVLLAGGGGAFKQGEYIHMGGRALNSLQFSLLRKLGLSVDQIEVFNKAGFGEYTANKFVSQNHYSSDAKKREMLPFLF